MSEPFYLNSIFRLRSNHVKFGKLPELFRLDWSKRLDDWTWQNVAGKGILFWCDFVYSQAYRDKRDELIKEVLCEWESSGKDKEFIEYIKTTLL